MRQEVKIDRSKALVLFSGGQDSATCLMWALDQFDQVETIGFDYRQRHLVELDVREEFLLRLRQDFPLWRNKLGEDYLIDLGGLASLGDTAMTHEVEFKANEDGLPNTFVPGRNIVFFTFAAALAYRRGANMSWRECVRQTTPLPRLSGRYNQIPTSYVKPWYGCAFCAPHAINVDRQSETWQLAKTLAGTSP